MQYCSVRLADRKKNVSGSRGANSGTAMAVPVVPAATAMSIYILNRKKHKLQKKKKKKKTVQW